MLLFSKLMIVIFFLAQELIIGNYTLLNDINFLKDREKEKLPDEYGKYFYGFFKTKDKHCINKLTRIMKFRCSGRRFWNFSIKIFVSI